MPSKFNHRKKFAYKNPVSRFNHNTIKLSNGVTFEIVNDFEHMEGPVNSFQAALDNWLARTDDYTAESFIRYVKSKEPNRIFMTKAQFDEIMEKNGEHATEEDYLSENN